MSIICYYNLKQEYQLINDYKNIIKKTNESQGHGKAWEIDIEEKIYGIENPKEKYNNDAKYDIPAEDNSLHHRNVSIKTSGVMNLCMSDIRRMLRSENTPRLIVLGRQNHACTKLYKLNKFLIE